MSRSSPPAPDSGNGSKSSSSESYAQSDANIRNFAPVARIMKSALPENAKIAKEAKECMQECVSEFISFITSEASEKCQQEKRKTVNGEDILFAMTSLGFENYAEALKIYLTKYREAQSARADNTQRPGSGYGGPGNAPGASGAAAPSNSAAAAPYQHQQSDAADSSLLAAQLGNPEQPANPYGTVYPGDGHNGPAEGGY
ncbi:hypothetical protein MMC10_008156 [Thelotrema lepadinum]|nr:hypothetical protein [Thelotrema lepadinum]